MIAVLIFRQQVAVPRQQAVLVLKIMVHSGMVEMHILVIGAAVAAAAGMVAVECTQVPAVADLLTRQLMAG
jgi:hypothetical protein